MADIIVRVKKCKDDACSSRELAKAISLANNDHVQVGKWLRRNWDGPAPAPKGICRMISSKMSETSVNNADQAVKMALGKYAKCMRERVSRLDDGVSGAEVVARALHGECSAYFNEAISISGSPTSADAIDALRKSIEQKATEMVLEHRASKNRKGKK